MTSFIADGWTTGRRWAGPAGSFVQAVLLLAARIWLSQAIFVHQLMAMMQAQGVVEAPSVGATLLRGVAPTLLVIGLLTRPMALLLALGIGLDAGVILTGPQLILLAWLAGAGAGPISLDYLLRRGLAQVPIWMVRAGNRLYARCDAIAGFALPFITRVDLALVIAGGSGFAVWSVPGTGALVTAPWWVLVPCWALALGIATRPAALLLCVLALTVFPGLWRAGSASCCCWPWLRLAVRVWLRLMRRSSGGSTGPPVGAELQTASCRTWL